MNLTSYYLSGHMQLVAEEPALAECCLGARGFGIPSSSSLSTALPAAIITSILQKRKIEDQRIPEVMQQPRGRDRARTESTGSFSSRTCHFPDRDTTKSLTICCSLD